MKISTKLLIAFLSGIFIFVGIGIFTGIFENDNPNDYILNKIKECWDQQGTVYVYTSTRRMECNIDNPSVEFYP